MNNIFTLEAVQKDFQQWRANRSKRVTIPNDLWQKVLPLLDTYPISKICSALSLNSAQIRSKLGNGHATKKNKSKAALIELPLVNNSSHPKIDEMCGVSIEITRKDGASISIKSYLSPSLQELINQFLGVN